MARNKPRKERCVLVYYKMYESPAFQNLSTNAVRILCEFKYRYNGYNNGTVSLSIKEIKTICGIGSKKASEALFELLTHGFIYIAKLGEFTTNLASEYTLTFEDMGKKKATNDWRFYPDNDGNKIRGKSLYEYRSNLDGYLATLINRVL